MAKGRAPSTIHQIWQAFGLQPHRTEIFKLSSVNGVGKMCRMAA
jgi:hypothetical protein